MSSARGASLAWIGTIALSGLLPDRAPPPRGFLDPDTLTTAQEVSGVRVIQRIGWPTDIVAVRLYLLGGTRQITDADAGVEALLLETSGYGTAQFAGAALRRAWGRTGCRTVFDPSADWTLFGFTGLADDFDAAWRVFADRVTEPTLSDTAVAQARAKLLAWAHRRYTEPDQRLARLAIRSLFEGHPYARDPGGTETSLAAITAADVRAYARSQLVTSRMLLVVVGNVSRAHLDSLVTASLGRLPRGDYRWTLPPSVPSHDAHWLVENRELPTTYLLGYFAGPPPGSSEHWAFRVATAALSGRLNAVIRQERSLSYATYAPYLDGAIPVGGAYATTSKPDSTFPLMLRAIEDLERGAYDPYRLGRLIDELGVDYLNERSSTAGEADLLARAELYLGSFRKAREFEHRLHAVTAYSLKATAARYMTHIQYAYLGDSSRMHGHW